MPEKPNKKSYRQSAFAQLQKSYGLRNPNQIKQRIILENVLAIAQAVYGQDEKNSRMMRVYKAQFKVCESQENRE